MSNYIVAIGNIVDEEDRLERNEKRGKVRVVAYFGFF